MTNPRNNPVFFVTPSRALCFDVMWRRDLPGLKSQMAQGLVAPDICDEYGDLLFSMVSGERMRIASPSHGKPLTLSYDLIGSIPSMEARPAQA
jgi:hypothetical protein